MKDTAFPREPSCTHLAHSLAKQPAIAGGKCNHLLANGQCIGSSRPMVSHARRACSGTVAFGAGLHCLGRLSSSSNAHRPAQGMRSGVPRGTPCSRACFGASRMSRVGWSQPITMPRHFSLSRGGRIMRLLGYSSLGALGWLGLTAC